MPKGSWFALAPVRSESALTDVHRRLLLFVCVATFYGTALLTLWAAKPPGPTAPGMLTMAYGLVFSVAAFLLQRRWHRAAIWIYAIGSLAYATLLLLVFRQAYFLAYLPLVILMITTLLGCGVGIVLGMVASALVIYLGRGWLTGQETAFTLGLIGLGYGFGFLVSQALTLVRYWEDELARQQRESVGQLRNRQGELNRTLKALDEAYGQLKRANVELLVARREAEEARALKEQFVANVSHELRTPLNLLVGFSEMMFLSPDSYDGVQWTPDLMGDIEEMYRAGRHLQSLVNDILDLSRIDASRLPMVRELQDLAAIIRETAATVDPLFRQRGLACQVELPEHLPQLFIDHTRIRQVMINLLNNAVRFTDEGVITVRAEQQEGAVLVGIHDTGIGIPEDELAHIFETFRQIGTDTHRRRGGAGLGLALSRQFIERHGGKMSVQSQEGVGSTFYFSLPLPGTIPQTTDLQHTKDRRRADLSDAPVIVVDPDPTIAEMLAGYLNNRRLLIARDTTEAEHLIEVAHPLAVIVNQLPDLPLADWLGTLGHWSAYYGVPVLRCSLPSPSWLKQSADLDDTMTKPISRDLLRQVVQTYCREPSTVLVVDDDPGFVHLMERMLRTMEGIEQIVCAYNGEQALRLAQEYSPALVFLDLLMPDMNGLEVARTLRMNPGLQGMRLVAVTATTYAEEALRRQGIYLTLTQATGISAGKVTEILNALLPCAHPDYTRGASTSSNV